MNLRTCLATSLVLFIAACKGAPPAAAPDATAAPVADVAGPTEAGADGAASATAPSPDAGAATASDAVESPDAGPSAPVDDDAPLALWPKVKRGTLPNGLTYYIMKHGTPAKRASLWLAVNAGSLLEDDDQRGLAHFVEHMAFNGTTHFEKSAIVDYLEGIGMRFGPDLNAYTSYDETVYQLLVPTDDAAFVGKGLDILRDWAGELSFDAAEVEKERGVVLEEWRLGRGPGERLAKQIHPVLFAGSRYAEREPIGLPDIIKGASRDTLVRFYKDWYRPDLMAVIAVGDFDPVAVEAEIQKRFANLQNPSAERPRTRAEVPKGGGTRVTIQTDHELSSTSVTVYDLVPHRPESTGNNLRRGIAEQIYQAAMDARFEILARKADAPYVGAGVGAQGLMREIDTFARSASVKGDRIEDALRALFTAVVRVERHGFTAGELERARAIIAKAYEGYELEEATADGTEYTAEMTRNFFEGELMIGRVAEAAAARRFLPLITLDELDAVAKGFGGADNRVVVISVRDGAPLPTKDKVLSIIDEVSKSDVPAWEDSGPAKPVMATPPTPGKVVSEKTIEAIGVTEWKLSNGAKVLVKPTDFQADSVSIVGSSPGGLATLLPANAPPADVVTARDGELVLALGGVGELDAIALNQAYAGKSATAGTFIDQVREGVSASGSSKDLEAIFQLMYLRVTTPRKDEAAFAVWKSGTKEALENGLKNPAVRYGRELVDDMYQKHPLMRSISAADLDLIDLDKALSYHQQRFGDVTDFTFTIVGEVDLKVLKPLVETYIASLPGAGRVEKEIDPGVELPPGAVVRTWHLGQEPKASVQLVFHGDETWSRDRERDLFILSEVLNLRLHQVLREDLGGVYGVSAGGTVSRSPDQERVLTIRFGCAPENVEKLVKATMDEAKALAKDGPTAEELAKVKQEFLRGREADLRQNGFWLGWLSANDRFGDDPTRILDPSGLIARMNPDDVKASAARNLDPTGLYEAVLLPEAPAPK